MKLVSPGRENVRTLAPSGRTSAGSAAWRENAIIKSARADISQRGKAATEPRGAFGVRGACSRCRTPRVIESGSKLHALQTLRDCAGAKHLRGLLANSTIVAKPVQSGNGLQQPTLGGSNFSSAVAATEIGASLRRL